jgi:hypothetical protein
MPSTSLDWRRSHHQAIRSIPDRVIPTGSLSGLTLSVTRSCPACNDGHQAFPGIARRRRRFPPASPLLRDVPLPGAALA